MRTNARRHRRNCDHHHRRNCGRHRHRSCGRRLSWARCIRHRSGGCIAARCCWAAKERCNWAGGAARCSWGAGARCNPAATVRCYSLHPAGRIAANSAPAPSAAKPAAVHPNSVRARRTAAAEPIRRETRTAASYPGYRCPRDSGWLLTERSGHPALRSGAIHRAWPRCSQIRYRDSPGPALQTGRQARRRAANCRWATASRHCPALR